MDIWHHVVDWIRVVGLSGLSIGLFIEGVGIPFPGETTLALFGFLANKGHYSLLNVILFATIGAWIGSWVSFFIGKKYGKPFLYRYGKYILLKQKQVDLTYLLSKRYGSLVLIIGRQIPGVRTVSSYVAGLGGMDWLKFLLYSLLGFAFWTSTWIIFGFIVSDKWQSLLKLFNSWLGLIFGTLFLISISFVYFRYKKKIRKMELK